MIKRVATLFIGACLWTVALVVSGAVARVAFEAASIGWRWIDLIR